MNKLDVQRFNEVIQQHLSRCGLYEETRLFYECIKPLLNIVANLPRDIYPWSASFDNPPDVSVQKESVQSSTVSDTATQSWRLIENCLNICHQLYPTYKNCLGLCQQGISEIYTQYNQRSIQCSMPPCEKSGIKLLSPRE